jgi:trehalose 6-phosphate synthase
VTDTAARNEEAGSDDWGHADEWPARDEQPGPPEWHSYDEPDEIVRPPRSHDLVVVANRLPVDRKEQPDGTTTWQPSPGGLVAALEPVMQTNAGAWVGWTGAPGEAPEPFDTDGIHLVPVALDESDVENFYEGMSNGTLWPLYHDVIVQPEFHRHWWDAYVRVNRRYAEAAAAVASEGALVWVQDYQLQLVPQMLRERRPDLRIGFFNHIPFPPYEIFAQLPWRRRVLEGLLGADQLGFQRPADANNFLRACRRNGLATRRGMVQLPPEPRFGSPEYHPRREVRAASFPISIDARRVEAIARRPDVRERAQQIRQELGDPKIVLLGVDRLDYTKGILHRLKAFEELLAEGRLAAADAVLVQVATPSRERVEQYQRLRDDVEVTVGRINGDHGQLGHPAVHYLHQAYPRHELGALYLAADVLLVTALRDGMNLVAKEYVASRYDERGALVLSEFAGAAIELPQSFLVNPHDIDGLKSTIMTAIALPPQEAQRRMRAMRRRIFEHDVARWAQTFLRVTSGRVVQDGELPAGPPPGASAAAGAVSAAGPDPVAGSGAAAGTGSAAEPAPVGQAHRPAQIHPSQQLAQAMSPPPVETAGEPRPLAEVAPAVAARLGSAGGTARSRMSGTVVISRAEATGGRVDVTRSGPGTSAPLAAGAGVGGMSHGRGTATPPRGHRPAPQSPPVGLPAVAAPHAQAGWTGHPGGMPPLPDALVDALERFATRQSLLVALDFDGVLAPIVAEPQAARMLPASRRQLTALTAMPGIRPALVSGRALADLRRVADPPPGVLLAGSHGAEIVDPDTGAELEVMLDQESRRLLQEVADALTAISERHPGTHVEHKPAGAVLHTRRAAADIGANATREALQGPATWPGVHLTHGKEVVELSVVDVGKGSAVKRLRAATQAEAVLYAGDDATDERAFAVLDDASGDVTIKVGPGETLARHRLDAPQDVAVMLEVLVELCQE